MSDISKTGNTNQPYMLDKLSNAQKKAENRADLIRCCKNGKDYTIKPNPGFVSLNSERFLGIQGGYPAPKNFYSAKVFITTTEGSQYERPQTRNGLVSVDPDSYGEAFVESSEPNPKGRGIKITSSEGKTEVYDLIGTIPVEKLSPALEAIQPETKQAEAATPKVDNQQPGATAPQITGKTPKKKLTTIAQEIVQAGKESINSTTLESLMKDKQ